MPRKPFLRDARNVAARAAALREGRCRELFQPEMLRPADGRVHRARNIQASRPREAHGRLFESSYHEITGKKDGCEHEEKGIVLSGNGIGHKKTICRGPECKKHWAKAAPGGHYKPTKEELAARKKARQAEAAKKEKANAALAAALERIKWPLSENALDVLIDLVFSRFGYSYLQPVAARHGIKAITTKEKYGNTRRDLDTPLHEWVNAQGKDGKLRFVFEVALEMTDNAKFIKRL
jgi:hypothetical protein